ncbi:hypothetical protein DFQ28_002914, partial [Apophysomyces sp. BC1034]
MSVNQIFADQSIYLNDLPTKDSQLDHLPQRVKTFVNKYRSTIPVQVDTSFNPDLSKIKSIKELRKAVDNLDVLPARNDMDRAFKRIAMHILNQITYAPHLLSDAKVANYSEQSTLVKFWCPILESFFSYDSRYELQWGDTESPTCQRQDLALKLDLRVVAAFEGFTMDAITGEAAKQAAITSKKLLNDKLKSSLATKAHLNLFVRSLKHLPDMHIGQVTIPIVQIMGLDFHLYGMKIVDKGLYIMDEYYKVTYPRSILELKKNGLTNIFTMLNIVIL